MKSIFLKVFVIIQSVFFLILNLNTDVSGQVVRSWNYSFNPPGNLEAAGNCIIHLDQGLTISGGNFKSTTNPERRNILLFTNDSGALIKADTSTLGFGFSKIIRGTSSCFAVAALQNDSNSARNILLAKIDTASLNINFYVPDSIQTIYYDQSDMIMLSNERLVIGSRMDNFPLVRLSLTCIDTAGTVVWQTVDSSFEIKYDLKLIADSSGGFYTSGSGRDTGTNDDFIFISHFNSAGSRDWFVRQNSPVTSFGDFLDLILDRNGHLWMSGVVMDTVGQVGVLLKLDTLGNVIWSRQVMPNPYQKLVIDPNNNIYGATVPMNGLDVFTLDKLDTSGTILNNTSFQLSGYFASILYDIMVTDDGRIDLTGDLFVLSFPKSDLFLASYDTSLNLIGYDIFDSLNLLGESGRAIAEGAGNDLFICGRMNYENQFETCNMGVIKYEMPVINKTNDLTTPADFGIYPNPSKGSFHLKWDGFSNDKINIRIFNSMGIEVFRELLFGQKGISNFNLNLSSGVYFITGEGKKNFSKNKLIIVE